MFSDTNNFQICSNLGQQISASKSEHDLLGTVLNTHIDEAITR